MATAANNASLILNISGTQSVALKRGEKTNVIAKAGQRYRVVKEGEEDAAKDVAASQKGQDLVLTYADGTQVVMVSFYEACRADQCAVDMPGARGTGSSGGYVITGDSAVGASLSDGGKLVYAFGDTPSMAALTHGAEQARGFMHQDSLSTYIPTNDAAAWTPLQVGLAGVGAAVLLPHKDNAAPVPTVIHGSVVAGPVVAGNGLTAVAYKADGTVLTLAVVNADGTFTLNVGNDYLGPVLVKVSDNNANPDYLDEATGAPKDLTTDLRALTVIPAAGTYNVSVNVLTELAVRSLGLTGGDTGSSSTTFTSVTQTQIVQANQQVAAAVGLTQDLVLGAAPVAIITINGTANSQTNDYGRLLAALSGAEVGSNTNAVLDDLVAKLQSTQAQATGQLLETLLEGAAQVNLVAAISDITNQKSNAITIDAVSQDNRLSPAEMIAGVVVQGTAAAGASVALAWSDSTGTATATGTRTVTADSQGHWSTSFTSAEMPALGATTLKASLGAAVATRSIYLDEPLAPTITLSQMTASSGNLTGNGHVDVSGILSGAAWDYSLDGGANWTAGSGSGFTVTGDGTKEVLVRQNIGGHISPISNRLEFVLDTTEPSPLGFALATDSGSNNSDGISYAGAVNVIGIESGATWEYSTNGGTTWSTGTGTSFTLAEASYAAGAINVRQTDVAANTSTAIGNSAAITIDTTGPSALSFALATDSGSSTSDGISSAGLVNVTGLESGATWEYSTNGGTTWSTGTGTSFTLAEASYATGSVKVRQTDVAGNISPVTSSTAAITMDATAPTVTITSSATSLGDNATATLTFTLSEAIADFGANNVTVTGGALSNFSGNGTSYTATFTPDAGLSGAATVNVAASVLTDAAGNTNSAASNTVSITVDTQAPSVASISASRSSLLVDQTATLSITLSEASTTFALADLEAVGGTLSNLQGFGTSYTAIFTPDDNRTAPGSVSVASRSFSDAAGNDNERSDNDGVVMAIQTLRPTATLQARQSKLGIGDGTVIDITLSEPSSDFSMADLTASHGTLSFFSALGGEAEEGTLYRVLFIPDANYTGIGSVTLADGRFTNAAGNTNGSGVQPVSTGDLVIDTTPPTVTITTDVTALAIGQSAKITFTFNKDPGDSFDATDITVNGGTLTNLVNNTGTIWTARFTPTDGSTGQASITVASGRYTDAAGNKGTAGAAPTITIDTQGPVTDSLLPGNATTVLPGNALVLNFSEAVHKGTGNIVLVDDTAGTRTTLAVTDSSVVLSNDGKTLTITPTTTLVAGRQYHVEADPASLLDAAGNAWAGIAASSTWAGSSWRFTAATPSVSLNKISTDNRVNSSENTAGVVISGSIESNTAGMVAAFVASDFAVTLTPQGGGANITATASNYNTTTGAWSLTLASNALVDGKTYNVSVAVTGTSGAASGATASTAVTLLTDLSAAAPTLTLLNDTGSSNSDGKTSDATVSVAGLEAKASWEYSTDSGTTWQVGSGNQFTGASTGGVHSVQVRQTDAAGNVSSNGTLSFTLDTTAAKPVINAIATNDVINASEVGSAITGTAEAGASVQLVLGTGKQERTVSVTADGSGNWTHTLNTADMAALGSGPTQVAAKQTDLAGNASFTTLHDVNVDTGLPTVSIDTINSRLTAGESTTQINFTLSETSTDFTASSVTVTGGTLSNFTGSAKQYTATFTPTNAGTTAGSITVAAGAFHDGAGNANAEASNTLQLTIDTVAPTVAISSNVTTLNAGDAATITFSLSEASDDFGLDSIQIVGGSLSQLSANAARTLFTGVFKPTEGFAGAGSVSVADRAFRDRGFNANADGADTNNTLALTIAAAPITLDITSDKTTLKAGETATISFTFSSAPTGFAAGDITVTGGTLGSLTTVDSTHYTATFTPTANAANGKATVSVVAGSYTGATGNLGGGASLAELSFDTLAPTLRTLNPEDGSYLAANSGTSLVATFTENVVAGTGTIQLVDDTTSTSQTYAIGDSAVVISGNTLTLTPTIALVAGRNYHINIDSTALLDAAGNAYVGISNATTWNFSASNLSNKLNTTSVSDGYVNAAEKSIAMAANGLVISGTLSSVAPAVLSSILASDITVRLTLPDRISDNTSSPSKVVTATIDSYDASTGLWSATLPKTWQYEQGYSNFFGWNSTGWQTRDVLTDGHLDTLQVIVNGRNGTAAAGLSVTLNQSLRVDLSSPATPTLTLAEDTGSSSNDGNTRNGLINVGGLEVGGTWQYSLDDGGFWQTGSGTSFAVSSDMATTVKVKQFDAAGNVSATNSLAVTLDTQANAPIVNAIATDNIINASEAGSAITGTAEAGASVSLVMGANTRTVTANGSGLWSYTLQAADITAMGQGNEVIKVTQTDKAGNTSSGTSAMIDVDTAIPTVALAVTGSASLLAGQSTTFTATLSEISRTFTADSLTVSGGTVTNFAADATGLVYTGTFVPDNNSTTAGSIQVASGVVVDAAGNTSSAASNTLALTINTVRPTVAVTSSVGPSTTLHAGDTATITFTLSQSASDFTAADVTTVGGSLSNWTAVSGTSYNATFTPDANSKAPGSVSVANGTFTNAATNANADGADSNNSVSFSIATVIPSVVISSDKGTLGGGQTATMTFEFSEAPGTSFSWDGSNGDLSVTGGTLSALKGSGTTYTALFTPTAGFSGAASITVASGSYTNSSGSLGQAGTSPAITIDAVAPTVAISRSTSGTLAAGQTDTVTFDFTEAPGSSFTLADLDISGGTLGEISAVSATRYVATFTPTAGVNGTAKIGLGSQRFSDAAGNLNTDGADTNNQLVVTYDTLAPTASTLAPTTLPNYGASLDTTGQLRMVFSEAIALGSQGNAAISLVDDTDPNHPILSVTASVVAGVGGVLNTLLITPSAPLTSNNKYHVTLAEGAVLDSAGNKFAGISNATTWNFTAAAPSPGGVTTTLDPIATDDKVNYDEALGQNPIVLSGTLSTTGGVLLSDFATTDLSVTVVTAEDTLTLSVDSYNPSTGAWTASLPGGSLGSSGSYFNAKVNVLGHTGTASGLTAWINKSFWVDTVIATPTLSLADDTGISSTDHITRAPVIRVSGLEAGAGWEYSTDAGSTWLSGSGNTFSLPELGAVVSNYASGAIRVRQTDAAGNSAENSMANAVAYSPTYLGNVSLSLARDTGASSTDGLTYDGTVLVSGLASTDTWRYSRDNGLTWTVGTSTTDLSGTRNLIADITPPNTVATQKVSVQVTDAAGNQGKVIDYSFSLDKKQPEVPNATVSANGTLAGPGNVEAGATLTYRLQAGSNPFSAWSSTYTPPTAFGNYTLQVQQQDAAGNGNVQTLTFSLAAPITPINLSDIAAGSGGFVISGQNIGDLYGASVSAAGDVNGDGLADFIVGSPKFVRSFVLFGKTSGSAINLSAPANSNSPSVGFVINGLCIGDNTGISVSAAGDVNGDGLADLIVGAPQSRVGTNELAGRSYVVYGKTSSTGVDLSAVANNSGGFVINGQCTNDYSGTSVSAAGDVNGDGLADLIVGAFSATTLSAGYGAGRSYVVFGSTVGANIDLSAVANQRGGFLINGAGMRHSSGKSVSAAGDVNGDGLGDLIIGAFEAYGSGASFVVFGKTSGVAIELSAVANVSSPSGGFVLKGECFMDGAGVSVSGAGDVNGDGLADLIIGASSYDLPGNPNAGRSYVVFGKTSATGINLSSVAAGVGGFAITGESKYDQSGSSVSAAGDVNGDGLGDLLVGAYNSQATTVKSGAGRTYVVFGKTSGTSIDLSAVVNQSGGFVIDGKSSSERSGSSVSAAGDVNGDGLADLILGAPGNTGTRGLSYVIFGNTTGAFSQTEVDWVGTDGDDIQNDSVVAKTLVAGAGNDSLTATAASVLYGGAGNDSFIIERAMITALQSPMGKGGNFDRLARIDGGTGIDTIVLSGSGLTFDLSKVANQAAGNPDGGSRIDSVEAIDLTGSGNNTLVLTASDVIDMAGMNLYNSGNGWTGLAASVARHQLRVEGNAGDVLKLGNEWVAARTTASVGGVSYKVYNSGSAAQLLVNDALAVSMPPPVVNLSALAMGVGGFVINGRCAFDFSGDSVSAAGDVNGDGLSDLIVGAPESMGYKGQSYVVFGKTTGTAIDVSAIVVGCGGFVINGQSPYDGSGFRVSAAGDVNADGLADLIVSSPGANRSAGRSYVVFGKTTGAAVNLPVTHGFEIRGQCMGESSGSDVSAAGDVNGDGLADLIVGAKYASLSAGRSYVVFGKITSSAVDLSTVDRGMGGFVINGECQGGSSGYSVASAGDVNGDGLADLIVGAPYTGRSYVVFGKTSGSAINLSSITSGNGGFVIIGHCNGDQSGISVSNAGDVNGDGLADMFVGANTSSPEAGRWAGRSYVVFGKTSGLAINLSAVAAGSGGFVINGECLYDTSGKSVSSAGDVNGDGLADLIVGASASNSNMLSGSGRSYVVFGKTSGTLVDLSAVANGVGGFAINGACQGDMSGASVSAAGDVNGDGLADLIVSAPFGDPTAGTNAGRSYVIFGSTTGAFGQTSVDWLGTDSADTQNDGGVSKTLVGGAGNDNLTATAASVLHGGAGNDSFTINGAMVTALQSPMGSGGNEARLARIDGGAGVDKIVLSGSSITLDLRLVANQAGGNPDGGSRIDSIESIDLTGSGNNTLILTAKDVLDMGSAKLFINNTRQQLMVLGNAGDTLDLADGTGTTGWIRATSEMISGVTHNTWIHTTSLAVVYVNTAVTVA